jgi:hypothetical protein
MKIDLYLRNSEELHLLEVKKPTEHRQWPDAAKQIVRQWRNSAHWLRRRQERVFLWAICPVRWSSRSRTARIPPKWRDELTAIKHSQLVGPFEAELGLLFYGISKTSAGMRLFLWRADEAAPQ